MAVNLKNITDLPVVESAEGLNLIVNDNGAAKQVAASAVGMQADFDVTDETSPAFIKNKPEIVQADWAETDESSAAFVRNKPVEEWDLDFTCEFVLDEEGYRNGEPVITINAGAFESLKNKILNVGFPKIKVKYSHFFGSKVTVQYSECFARYVQDNFLGNSECIIIKGYSDYDNELWYFELLPDNTILFD